MSLSRQTTCNLSNQFVTSWKCLLTQTMVSIKLTPKIEERTSTASLASVSHGEWERHSTKEARNSLITLSRIILRPLSSPVLSLYSIITMTWRGQRTGFHGMPKFKNLNTSRTCHSSTWWCLQLTLISIVTVLNSFYQSGSLFSSLVRPVLVNQLLSWIRSKFYQSSRKTAPVCPSLESILTSRLKLTQREYSSPSKRKWKGHVLSSKPHPARESPFSLTILICLLSKSTVHSHQLNS